MENELARGREPVRMCVVCRRRMPKRELTRYVVTPEGGSKVDEDGTRPGRGRYVCSDPQCIDRFGHCGRHGRK